MNCLFCKQNSDQSKSVEHIIPFSLGNQEHILPKGVVCDSCNNYFALKIEKVLLEQDYFRSVRSRNNILNRKGRQVAEIGIISHPEGCVVDVYKTTDGIIVEIPNKKIQELIRSGATRSLYLPLYSGPIANDLVLSRLLGKMSIEALTKKFISIDGWEDETIYKRELDMLRNYARYGNHTIRFWPYYQRNIYDEGASFFDLERSKGSFEILHEYTFHYSTEGILYFIIVIMGIEYTINMAEPEIKTYEKLIKERDYKGFLSEPLKTDS